MNTRHVFLHGAVGLLAVALFAPLTARAGSLDKALLDNGLDVLVKLREAGVKTVGVLPFRVKRGARGTAFNVAPLATNLPGRLENALVLRQSADTEVPIQVIRDAAGVASKNKVGSWMTERGAFARLFLSKYPLVWGEEKLGLNKHDAFLTGEVVADLEKGEAKVSVKMITPKSWKDGKVVAKSLVTFPCKMDRDLMRDLGYNFVLPPDKVGSRTIRPPELNKHAQEQLKKEEEGKDKPPEVGSATSHSPTDVAGLKVEVFYNGVAQKVAKVPGGEGAKQPLFEVPTPKAGQEVVLKITRLSDKGGKLGAVLRVNGRSTYAEQDGPVEGCKRWVFLPEKAGKPMTYEGFYHKADGKKEGKKDGKFVVVPFEVLGEEESKARASELGTRAGWIDLDVFVESEAPLDLGDKSDADGLVISTRGGFRARGATFADAQKKIATANNLKLENLSFNKKGLIGTGVKRAKTEPFKSVEMKNPRHVGGISIRYYARPEAGGDSDKVLD
jgi:hypothetical protein